MATRASGNVHNKHFVLVSLPSCATKANSTALAALTPYTAAATIAAAPPVTSVTPTRFAINQRVGSIRAILTSATRPPQSALTTLSARRPLIDNCKCSVTCDFVSFNEDERGVGTAETGLAGLSRLTRLSRIAVATAWPFSWQSVRTFWSNFSDRVCDVGIVKLDDPKVANQMKFSARYNKPSTVQHHFTISRKLQCLIASDVDVDA
ncbi:hypothetical protein EYE42_14490 [Paracoccus subflavus]|uniref:Uncharacterized protein n=1 Tax=Paracoccus subflavus TaxID=2528244 RepID=A0A4Q9FXA4_9RHOB|nr:hypothetical protein [Paracoccus subflavus]TBN37235.1 hypothetical protein EYE42_14490 [Paracoccus subflavus]